MRVLLITPPLVQCNTPYAATPLLTACLRQAGIEAVQADASLELLLRLFSAAGLARVQACVQARPVPGPAGRHFLAHYDRYALAIGPVLRFLQGKDPTLAYRLLAEDFLPRGPRFALMQAQETDDAGTLQWAFGSLAAHDQARYLASLCLDDLAQVVREEVDPAFGLSRYAERLAASLPDFAPLGQRLAAPPTLIDELLDELADALLARHDPAFIGFTVPFPGCLYGALRLARRLRRQRPGLPVALGGGYVNTELRELAEPRLFDDVDYVCLDAGPEPLLAALRHARGEVPESGLRRCFRRASGRVVYHAGAGADTPTAELPPPTFAGLPLGDYVSLVEMLNPMHALWSNGRWNKLMLAHGCYWRRCRFCDTSLDYIRRYDPAPAARLADHLERLVAETGQTGFHFVDEAAAPALLRALAEELLRRRLVVTWWGNIRFEKAFDAPLAELLAASGCVALTGGLEAAGDRLLKLIDKGVTVAQAARVCAALTRSGILLHAYLMYGLPGQTVQETVDALERVRQLFAAGCLQSAYWHRFSATVHSDIGQHPERYGIELLPAAGTFARNELPFRDPLGVDHDQLGAGLKKAVYNYMHGLGLEEDVRTWFEGSVPRPQVPRREIAQALRQG